MTSTRSCQLYTVPNTNIQVFFASQPASELLAVYAKIAGEFFHLGQFSAQHQQWWEATCSILESSRKKASSVWEYISCQTLYKKNYTHLFAKANIPLIALKHIEILASWFATQRLKNHQAPPNDALLRQEAKLQEKLRLIGFRF